MSDKPFAPVPVPPEFLAHVHDAVGHLYDHAYLVNHPLLQHLQAYLGAGSDTATHNLRRLLLEAIEALRPPHGTPTAHAAWRPYNVLRGRYVLGQDLDGLERELGLGRRQLLREQARGLEAMARALWERRQALVGAGRPASGSSEARDVLLQEISRVATERQSFDAVAQLEAALAPVRALAHDHRVVLQVERPDGPLEVTGDPLLFRQLLVGALSLAVRYEGVQRVSVRLESGRHGLLCTIVAEPVYPPVGSDGPEPLPEAISYLADALGAAMVLQHQQARWRLQVGLACGPSERTVLMVEDNPDLVTLFARYLEGHGYRLLAESDSAQALARIAELMPDVVVLDVMMRDVDGWQLLQRLKADDRLRAIPVLVCSVLDERQLATSLGAAAYLRKPVRPAHLLECLRRLLPA